MERRGRPNKRSTARRFSAKDYLALMLIPVAILAMLGFTAFPGEATGPGFRLGSFADLVAGELIDPSVADEATPSDISYPSFVPDGLMLAGIVRSFVFEDTFYLVYDRVPLKSGEFRRSELMDAGAIILIEEPDPFVTVEQREAYVANSIEVTNGKVGRVMVNGHVGLIGHGEIPQIRWWQDGLQLFIQGYLTDEEFIAIAESVQPRGQ